MRKIALKVTENVVYIAGGIAGLLIWAGGFVITLITGGNWREYLQMLNDLN